MNMRKLILNYQLSILHLISSSFSFKSEGFRHIEIEESLIVDGVLPKI